MKFKIVVFSSLLCLQFNHTKAHLGYLSAFEKKSKNLDTSNVNILIDKNSEVLSKNFRLDYNNHNQNSQHDRDHSRQDISVIFMPHQHYNQFTDRSFNNIQNDNKESSDRKSVFFKGHEIGENEFEVNNHQKDDYDFGPNRLIRGAIGHNNDLIIQINKNDKKQLGRLENNDINILLKNEMGLDENQYLAFGFIGNKEDRNQKMKLKLLKKIKKLKNPIKIKNHHIHGILMNKLHNSRSYVNSSIIKPTENDIEEMIPYNIVPGYVVISEKEKSHIDSNINTLRRSAFLINPLQNLDVGQTEKESKKLENDSQHITNISKDVANINKLHVDVINGTKHNLYKYLFHDPSYFDHVINKKKVIKVPIVQLSQPQELFLQDNKLTQVNDIYVSGLLPTFHNKRPINSSKNGFDVQDSYVKKYIIAKPHSYKKTIINPVITRRDVIKPVTINKLPLPDGSQKNNLLNGQIIILNETMYISGISPHLKIPHPSTQDINYDDPEYNKIIIKNIFDKFLLKDVKDEKVESNYKSDPNVKYLDIVQLKHNFMDNSKTLDYLLIDPEIREAVKIKVPHSSLIKYEKFLSGNEKLARNGIIVIPGVITVPITTDDKRILTEVLSSHNERFMQLFYKKINAYSEKESNHNNKYQGLNRNIWKYIKYQKKRVNGHTPITFWNLKPTENPVNIVKLEHVTIEEPIKHIKYSEKISGWKNLAYLKRKRNLHKYIINGFKHLDYTPMKKKVKYNITAKLPFMLRKKVRYVGPEYRTIIAGMWNYIPYISKLIKLRTFTILGNLRLANYIIHIIDNWKSTTKDEVATEASNYVGEKGKNEYVIHSNGKLNIHKYLIGDLKHIDYVVIHKKMIVPSIDKPRIESYIQTKKYSLKHQLSPEHKLSITSKFNTNLETNTESSINQKKFSIMYAIKKPYVYTEKYQNSKPKYQKMDGGTWTYISYPRKLVKQAKTLTDLNRWNTRQSEKIIDINRWKTSAKEDTTTDSTIYVSNNIKKEYRVRSDGKLNIHKYLIGNQKYTNYMIIRQKLILPITNKTHSAYKVEENTHSLEDHKLFPKNKLSISRKNENMHISEIISGTTTESSAGESKFSMKYNIKKPRIYKGKIEYIKPEYRRIHGDMWRYISYPRKLARNRTLTMLDNLKQSRYIVDIKKWKNSFKNKVTTHTTNYVSHNIKKEYRIRSNLKLNIHKYLIGDLKYTNYMLIHKKFILPIINKTRSISKVEEKTYSFEDHKLFPKDKLGISRKNENMLISEDISGITTESSINQKKFSMMYAMKKPYVYSKQTEYDVKPEFHKIDGGMWSYIPYTTEFVQYRSFKIPDNFRQSKHIIHMHNWKTNFKYEATTEAINYEQKNKQKEYIVSSKGRMNIHKYLLGDSKYVQYVTIRKKIVLPIVKKPNIVSKISQENYSLEDRQILLKPKLNISSMYDKIRIVKTTVETTTESIIRERKYSMMYSIKKPSAYKTKIEYTNPKYQKISGGMWTYIPYTKKFIKYRTFTFGGKFRGKTNRKISKIN